MKDNGEFEPVDYFRVFVMFILAMIMVYYMYSEFSDYMNTFEFCDNCADWI